MCLTCLYSAVRDTVCVSQWTVVSPQVACPLCFHAATVQTKHRRTYIIHNSHFKILTSNICRSSGAQFWSGPLLGIIPHLSFPAFPVIYLLSLSNKGTNWRNKKKNGWLTENESTASLIINLEFTFFIKKKNGWFNLLKCEDLVLLFHIPVN